MALANQHGPSKPVRISNLIRANLKQKASLVEETQHFTTNILSPSLFMIHDTSRGCQDNIPKLHHFEQPKFRGKQEKPYAYKRITDNIKFNHRQVSNFTSTQLNIHQSLKTIRANFIKEQAKTNFQQLTIQILQVLQFTEEIFLFCCPGNNNTSYRYRLAFFKFKVLFLVHLFPLEGELKTQFQESS